MHQLTADEARVLGVLIEKAQTTPAQYPLSLNGLVMGCNQKNNRLPVMTLSEERVFDALDTLRSKSFARQVDMSGSRVEKFRHIAREVLEVDTSQLVILAELLLRGPQTIGELRGRASRMHPIESLEVVGNIMESLMERAEPLVKSVAPLPGSRAGRFAQLLCPGLHRIEAAEEVTAGGPREEVAVTRAAAVPDALAARVGRLEQRVDALIAAVAELKDSQVLRASDDITSD